MPVGRADIVGWASRTGYNQHADHYYYVTFTDRDSGYVTSACGAIETHIDNLAGVSHPHNKCGNCMHTDVAKIEIAKQFRKPEPEPVISDFVDTAISSSWITDAIAQAKSEINNLDALKVEIRDRCTDLEEVIAYLEQLQKNQLKL